MVVELANEVVAALDGGPPEERVGLELHGALALNDAVALVCGFAFAAQVGRVARGSLFLDLQEERVLGAIALHEDAVVAQAD